MAVIGLKLRKKFYAMCMHEDKIEKYESIGVEQDLSPIA